jgi:hypothetical protein
MAAVIAPSSSNALMHEWSRVSTFLGKLAGMQEVPVSGSACAAEGMATFTKLVFGVRKCSPFRSEIFAPTRTAQGNEQGNAQGGKHKNKLKLNPKHNNKRKELTRADRLHKSKRRQHVFLDAGPNWIEISFFL